MATAPNSIAIGDWNGDHVADLATGNFGPIVLSPPGTTASVLLGTGDGTYGAHVEYATGSKPFGIGAADLNGDAVQDLAVTSQGNNLVSVLLGMRDGRFESRTDYATTAEPRSVAIGDVNRDGAPDLAVACRLSNLVSVFPNAGNGSFPTRLQVPVITAKDVQLADLNRDGFLDLVALREYFNESGGAVAVFLGHDDATFGAATNYAVKKNPVSLAVSDLTGDGLLDIAVAHQNGNAELQPTPFTVFVLRGNGNGAFGALANVAVGSRPAGLDVGDLNGDGAIDIAVACSDRNCVSVLINNGDGTSWSRTDYGTFWFRISWVAS